MSETADSSLACAGPLVSVATTGTNRFPCVDSILAKRWLTSSRVQAGQLTSGSDQNMRIWTHENSARFYRFVAP